MAIKRKTHLNLSGSHHTLDSDNAFVGGTLYITGTLSASAGITGSIHYVDAAASVPFIAGDNITVTYNASGQWELTGSSGTNYWTELALDSIKTTGSVTITGSLMQGGALNQAPYSSNSHAEGYSTLASGYASHAEGAYTIASGPQSHAEGYYTQASGDQSHAEGFQTLAQGTGSLAAGLGTIANGPTDGGSPTTTQAVFGKYNISNADALFVVGDGTGPSQFGRHNALALVSGSQGTSVQITGSLEVLGGITGSLSGTTGGLPFLVSGGNMGGVNYNGSTGQWEITGSGGGGSPGGANTQIQFNENGTTFQGDAQLTFNTASVGSLTPYTLAAPTASFKVLSGSNDTTFLTSFGIAEALLVNSNVAVTQSMIFFDGKDQAIDAGGTMYLNGASIEMYSGSAVGDSDFTIAPNVDGSGGVYVKFDNLINIRPLYVTMSTGNANPTLLSGSLLTGSLISATISKLDFNVIAIEQASDNFASWTFSATIRSNLIDQRTVLAATELDSVFEGANASTWDVNINTNGDIYCTGSAGTVHWYAQVTKKMVLSGSGDLLY